MEEDNVIANMTCVCIVGIEVNVQIIRYLPMNI
jgi:hypothetical protein